MSRLRLQRGRPRPRLSALALGVVVLLTVSAADAQNRGIQLSRDRTRVLVNKDVGSERWAISRNTLTDTLTGNVFAADGGPPSFIFCEPTGAPNSYACAGSGPCASADCLGRFVDLGVVTLPVDFFAPPGVAPSGGVSSEVAARDRTAHAAMTNVGLQETPDLEHVLVSSDVGNERWAIALNRRDRTLTGNVFFPDGGAPAFVSCLQALHQPGTFDCYGAGPCVENGCENQYTFLSTVALPDEFFGSHACGNGRVEGNERCEAGAFCFSVCGVDSLCNILVGVAPLPMPGVCTEDCQVCVPL